MAISSESLSNRIVWIPVESELKKSYIDYAMSVIVGRALPNVCDGLKPVHRRILFAMHELQNYYNKAYKKAARVVGDVIGKYHPHGDNAIYDSIVRMAQDFSLRYLLVDGQGNFGSVDGDAPAAMRYTEVRMSRMAHFLLADLEKNTVDFVPNYDGTERMPAVLPTRIPNLLINGSSGIAVGMATNIPTHNLAETIDAILALMEDPDLSVLDLMQYIPGPDFPTGGIISGRSGIVQAYETGRGRIYLHAKTHIEEDADSGKIAIIVDELPYQVNKSRLLEKIGELVRDKKIDGISALRDESDQHGMRVVIEIGRGTQADFILNNLYHHTQLQLAFSINMVVLQNDQPKLMNLKELLLAFIRHRYDIVTRRTRHELAQARARAHILEGLAIALEHIDHMIVLIQSTQSSSDAKKTLIEKIWHADGIASLLDHSEDMKLDAHDAQGIKESGYSLSPEQVQAILDLRLHRLTSLEKEKIHSEYKSLVIEVKKLLSTLNDFTQLRTVVREELLEVKTQFFDERRTQIVHTHQEINSEDLIIKEQVVVTLSHEGYIKSQILSSYQAQRRGGRGKSSASLKEEDFMKHIVVASTLDTILCFSSIGKVYWIKAHQIPFGSRTARGRPIVNLLAFSDPEHETISTILPVQKFTDRYFIFMTTAHGLVKKVALSEFAKPRTSGKTAIVLGPEDRLIGAVLTDGQQEMMLFSDAGQALRFQESEVRVMGRMARGVRGMRLGMKHKVIALLVLKENLAILTATQHGYGKRTVPEHYRRVARGCSGVRSIRINHRNGPVVAAVAVHDADEVLFLSSQGVLIRTRAREIPMIGRNTQGVRLIQLGENEQLVGVETLLMDLHNESLHEPLSVVEQVSLDPQDEQ